MTDPLTKYLLGVQAARAAKYAEFMSQLKETLESNAPEDKAFVARANARLARIKTLGTGTVHVDAVLSNISVQYANGDYIGLELLPVCKVPKLSDIFLKYDRRGRMGRNDDRIGVRGKANEINEGRSRDNYSCQDYGLMDFLDGNVLANQDAPLDEMVDLTESVNENVAFNREVRHAGILTTASNYGANNQVTIASGAQWDSANGGGDPVSDLQLANARLWQGRGPSDKVAFCSLGIFNALARHPKIRDLFKYTGPDGLAMPDQIARYFGWSKLLVSETRIDNANEGQAENYGRLWGNFFGVVRVAKRPQLRNAAFGYTMRFGAVDTDQWFDVSIGRKGGYYARTAVSEDYKVVANDTGFLISSPVSAAAATA